MSGTPRLPAISPRTDLSCARQEQKPARDVEIRRLQMLNLSPRIDATSGGRIGGLPQVGERGVRAPQTHARKPAFTTALTKSAMESRHLRPEAPTDEDADERIQRRRQALAEERRARVELARSREAARQAERKRRRQRREASATTVQSAARARASRREAQARRERRDEQLYAAQLESKASEIQSILRGRWGRSSLRQENKA